MQKVYRNPARQQTKEERSAYVPQYVALGLEPTESSMLPRDAEVPDASFSMDQAQNFSSEEDENQSIVDDLDGPIPSFQKYDEYVLLLDGKLHFKGSSSEMNDYVSALVFGEHPDFPEPVSPDNLIVLKRIQIKVGVFLE